MDRKTLSGILDAYKDGSLGLEAALERLKDFPEADLGFARLDTQRELRVGFPEVVYCAGKSDGQLRAILERLLEGSGAILATRASQAQYDYLGDLSPELRYDPASRAITARLPAEPSPGGPYAAVVAAGTSDFAVAEEAAVTLRAFGIRTERAYDVGVAGLHRLVSRLELIRGAAVVVTVAGMEGALASVVGGLVAAPVIAVPTSVGYGASFGGLSALLTMLNSCASGVSVVNIDNGFGAGYQAALIARAAAGRSATG